MLYSQELIIEEILQLKREKNALLLAHNYQIPEIQDIADFVGDSFELSLRAQETTHKLIVLCGVYFMAQTAFILSRKRVLVPVLSAGCPLADMVKPDDVHRLREEHPEAVVMAYINSTAEVKALSDVICTSANALTLAEKIPSREIIFLPDRGLGWWIQERTEKVVYLWPGFCPPHFHLLPIDIIKAKEDHPQAKVLVHPECRPEVRRLADQVLGTGGMLRFVHVDQGEEYIIGTEEGLLHRLRKENPNKKFYLASPFLSCPNMKKTDLDSLLQCLREEKPEVTVSPEIAERARLALIKMIELS